MQRSLVSRIDQLALQHVAASEFNAVSARVRKAMGVDATWRLCPSLECFYNPDGMSAGDIVAYDAAQLASRALATSRQKDILALLACSVRGRNVAAWNAMTTPQKVAATLAEADAWKTIREFIDDKV